MPNGCLYPYAGVFDPGQFAFVPGEERDEMGGSNVTAYITTAQFRCTCSILLHSSGALLALRKEMMKFGTGSVPFRIDIYAFMLCVCRTRQSHDGPTRHGYKPRKASLVLLSPHITRLCIRSRQPCSIRLAPHFSPLHGYVEVLCSAAKRGGPFPHTFRRSRRPHRFYCVRFPLATVPPTVTSTQAS